MFNLLTERHGWSTANQSISMLRSVYRRACVDHEGLRNPVELWIAGGGRFNPNRRRRISAPTEVLPRWRAGMEAVRLSPAHRDIFMIGVYTGMRLGEVVSLGWERVDLERRVPRVEETKTGEPLELPITRQLAAVLERCHDRSGGEGWLFPSTLSATGHLAETAEVFVHGLCQAFMKRGLPRSPLTDNGAPMMAGEVQEGLHRLGIVHATTLARIPRTKTENAKSGGLPSRAVSCHAGGCRAELHLRVARWDLSSVDLVDGRSGERVSVLYPLDRRATPTARATAPAVPCLRRFEADPPGPVLMFAAEDAGHIVRTRLSGRAGRGRAGARNPRTAHRPGARRRRNAALAAPDPRTRRDPAQDRRRDPREARLRRTRRARRCGRLQHRRSRNEKADAGRRRQR